MTTDGNDAVFEQVRDAYMAPIYARVRRDAEAAAENGELTPADVFRAFDAHLRGDPHRGILVFLRDNLFLVAAMLLTLAFGAFGLYHPDDGDVAGFLDIAKIFAGAVVGGAAAGGTAAFTRRRTEAD